jgi:Retroviral aspartyl protease./Retrotransposon gag protein.
VAQKKREFYSLQQGTRTVIEYLHEFNRLARYAPEDVRTDVERQEKFWSSLDNELINQLMKLVDKAIHQEEQCNKMNRKRKASQFRTLQGNSQKPRFMTGQQGGPSTLIVRQHHPYHPSNFNNDYNCGSHNSSEQHNQSSTPPSLMAPAQSDPPAMPAQSEQPKKESGGNPGPYFNCGKHGHFAGKCPKPKRAGPRVVQARINHASVEEARAAQEVVLGTFPVNSHPTAVLFDSGATHSFISKNLLGHMDYR